MIIIIVYVIIRIKLKIYTIKQKMQFRDVYIMILEKRIKEC
jgi:hypothetical protein